MVYGQILPDNRLAHLRSEWIPIRVTVEQYRRAVLVCLEDDLGLRTFLLKSFVELRALLGALRRVDDAGEKIPEVLAEL